MIIFGFLLVVANVIFASVRYFFALINVEQHAVSTNLGYILLFTIMPIVWWAYSTKEESWRFYNRKMAALKLSITCTALTLANPIWTLVFDTIVIRICRLPVGRNLDATMLLHLCRIFLVLIPGTFILTMTAGLFTYMKRPDIELAIQKFKWQLLFDTRKNKEYKYDLTIIKNLKTGNIVKIKEEDRRVHMLIPGVSGTGKTSSTFIPGIICDLNNKERNKVMRHKALKLMVKNGKARVTRPDAGHDIDEWCVKANKGFEPELADIRKTFSDCGITVMAPNNAMNKDVIKLAKARHEMINVIDPAVIYKDKNVKNVCINPFYIPKGLTIEDRLIAIISKAQTFASVIVAVNDLAGGGEQYFKDINTSVTTNIAMLCMLNACYNGTQTCMSEVQTCINSWSKLQTIVDEVQEHLHIKINTYDFAQNKDNRGITTAEEVREMNDASYSTDFEFFPVESENDLPEWAKQMGLTVNECNETLLKEAHSYYNPIFSVLSELLGSNSEEMYKQSTGLRNIINKMMRHPRNKRVLDGKEEGILDFDQALEKNEITVINTNLADGAENSTGLGLFLLMMLKISVLKRPVETRSNHFLYVDEASQYMHPVYEDMFALFRQYNVSCCLAVQTLTQMYKTPATRYLKGVLTGAGIHIVFGRLSVEEMKFYEEMGGKQYVTQVQQSTSENSEFDPRYNITRSTRSQQTLESNIAGHSARSRNMLEVTVYMVDEGNVKDGFLATTSWPEKKEYEERENNYVDFRDLATFSMNDDEPVRTLTKAQYNAYEIVELKKMLAKSKNRRREQVLKMDDLKPVDEEEIMDDIERQRQLLKEKYGRKDEITVTDDKNDENESHAETISEDDESLNIILAQFGYDIKENTSNQPTSNTSESEKNSENKQEEHKKHERTNVLEDDGYSKLFEDMGITTVQQPDKPKPKRKKKKSSNSRKQSPNKDQHITEINEQNNRKKENPDEEEAIMLITKSLNNGTFG